MGSKSKEGSEGSSKKKRKSEAASDVVEGKKRKEGKELSKASGGSSSRGEGTRVAIRVEKEAEGTSGTMLACFSNAPPPVADLQDGGIMLGCEAHGTRKRVLTGETKTLLFEGSDDCGTGSAFKYMVGLYDPDKGEVVVADPGPGVSGNVVSLRRRVKSMASGGTLGEMTKEQARDALVDVFGSKRVRSVYKQRKGQELEKEGTDVLGKLERELQVKKEESKAAHAAAATAGEDEGPSDLAPKCNMKASSPAEAYLRKDVIGEEEWESLAPVQILDMAKDPSGEAASMLPTYIRAQLPALLKTEDKKDRRKRAKLLMYAAFLVLFNALPSRLEIARLSDNKLLCTHSCWGFFFQG